MTAAEELVAAFESGDKKQLDAALIRAAEQGIPKEALRTMIKYLLDCGFEPAVAVCALVR